MIATVRDVRGITHIAIRLPDEDSPHEAPIIGALCEDTIGNFLGGLFTAWTSNEVGEGLPDCMSCLVRSVS